MSCVYATRRQGASCLHTSAPAMNRSTVRQTETQCRCGTRQEESSEGCMAWRHADRLETKETVTIIDGVAGIAGVVPLALTAAKCSRETPESVTRHMISK